MEKSDDENKAEESSSDTNDNNRASSSSATFHKKRVMRRSYRRKRSGGGEEASSSNMDDNDKPGGSTFAGEKLKKLRKSADREATSPPSGEGAPSKLDDSDTESEAKNEKGGEPNSDEWTSAEEEEACVIPRALRSMKPKSTFSTVNEIMQRQIGQSKHFQTRFYGSLGTVERLQLLHSLKEHRGCVNTVEFNEIGDLIVSGSDDLAVCVWDWATGRKRNSYESGHMNNIFQASWLPRDNLTTMVTCASDGQVRLLDLVQGTTRKLASHRGACNKFAIHPDTPHVAISVGDDGKVLSTDVRDDETTELVTMKERASAIQLYTIHSNPRNSHEFCVGGYSESVKIFDRRKASVPLYRLCPTKLIGNKRVHITAVTYNYNGTEILGSYNDEDIYLFDTLIPHPTGDYAHKYQGHRNCRTIKGVNYFGPNSEFIVSGSDCGNIFFWEKNTEAIVQCVRGDDQGVVNCVKPHPNIPVLASSGLDDDVKIWVPSADGSPPMTKLIECVTLNVTEREQGWPDHENFHDRNLSRNIIEHFRQNPELFDLILERRSGGTFDDDGDDDDDDD